MSISSKVYHLIIIHQDRREGVGTRWSHTKKQREPGLKCKRSEFDLWPWTVWTTWTLNYHPTSLSFSSEDPGLILGSGRYPEEWNSYLLQYSCLGNPMDRGAWQAMVHGGRKEWDMAKCLSTYDQIISVWRGSNRKDTWCKLKTCTL